MHRRRGVRSQRAWSARAASGTVPRADPERVGQRGGERGASRLGPCATDQQVGKACDAYRGSLRCAHEHVNGKA